MQEITINLQDLEDALVGDLDAFQRILIDNPATLNVATMTMMRERAEAVRQADANNSYALTILGYLRSNPGFHNFHNGHSAVQWLEQAAAAPMSNPWAMHGLANMHRAGNYRNDKLEAAKLYRSAVRLLGPRVAIRSGIAKLISTCNTSLILAQCAMATHDVEKLRLAGREIKFEAIRVIYDDPDNTISLAVKDKLLVKIIPMEGAFGDNSRGDHLKVLRLVAESHARQSERLLLDRDDVELLAPFVEPGPAVVVPQGGLFNGAQLFGGVAPVVPIVAPKAAEPVDALQLGMQMLEFANVCLEHFKSILLTYRKDYPYHQVNVGYIEESIDVLYHLIHTINARVGAVHVDVSDPSQVADVVGDLMSAEKMDTEQYYLLADLILKLDSEAYFINHKDKYRLMISLLGRVAEPMREKCDAYEIILWQAMANIRSELTTFAGERPAFNCVRFETLVNLIAGPGSAKLITYSRSTENSLLGTPKATEILKKHFDNSNVPTFSFEKLLCSSYEEAIAVDLLETEAKAKAAEAEVAKAAAKTVKKEEVEAAATEAVKKAAEAKAAQAKVNATEVKAPLDIVYLETQLLNNFLESVKFVAAKGALLSSGKADPDMLVLDHKGMGAGMKRGVMLAKKGRKENVFVPMDPQQARESHRRDMFVKCIDRARDQYKIEYKLTKVPEADQLRESCHAGMTANERLLLILDYLEKSSGKFYKGSFKLYLLRNLAAALNWGNVKLIESDPWAFTKQLCVTVRKQLADEAALLLPPVPAADGTVPGTPVAGSTFWSMYSQSTSWLKRKMGRQSSVDGVAVPAQQPVSGSEDGLELTSVGDLDLLPLSPAAVAPEGSEVVSPVVLQENGANDPIATQTAAQQAAQSPVNQVKAQSVGGGFFAGLFSRGTAPVATPVASSPSAVDVVAPPQSVLEVEVFPEFPSEEVLVLKSFTADEAFSLGSGEGGAFFQPVEEGAVEEEEDDDAFVAALVGQLARQPTYFEEEAVDLESGSPAQLDL